MALINSFNVIGKAVVALVVLGLAAGGWYFFLRTEDAAVLCNNSVKDEGEEEVDCGGPCPPCISCHDGIQNQNESGVDCGGPCMPCMKVDGCGDGLMNQGETGVDCGGPCMPCASINCTIFNKTRVYEIPGWKLDAKLLKRDLLNATVDYIYLDPERSAYKKVWFDCKWGVEIGERVDLYYCMSNYTAPKLRENNTITGYLSKSFKVGMGVDRHRREGKPYTRFAMKTLNETCYNASKPV
mgnify:CR=1 FL=1